MAGITAHRAGRRQIFFIRMGLFQLNLFEDCVTLLCCFPVAPDAGIVVGSQVIKDIVRIFDISGAGGLGFVMAAFGAAADNFTFTVPVMVAVLAGKSEMGAVGEIHSPLFGVYALRRFNGQVAQGNGQGFTGIFRFGMGFGMASLTFDGAGGNLFDAGSLLFRHFISVTIAAGLVKCPGQ